MIEIFLQMGLTSFKFNLMRTVHSNVWRNLHDGIYQYCVVHINLCIFYVNRPLPSFKLHICWTKKYSHLSFGGNMIQFLGLIHFKQYDGLMMINWIRLKVLLLTCINCLYSRHYWMSKAWIRGSLFTLINYERVILIQNQRLSRNK